ncbi:amino acid ABC transporter permease [Cohnella fermenti]|uniref:Amino acid ABC transporter permease n=1 Tax=Cohnella fermenti TaxID=2565925 RepID=A0A4S4C728_9BACL|nr:amino acid ABC transporter permease [Cohnella fermenti]THF83671.1 amino acid ABC transporter permease [Cohnella fermenti]
MKLDPAFIWTAFVKLLPAIPITLYLTVISVLAGLLFGTGIALLRIYRVPVLSQIASGYVTFIRGTPMLVHLYLVYFGLPAIIDVVSESFGWSFRSVSVPYFVFAVIAFTITASAYMSEVVRSGLLAVNRGQLEAAHSIGMTTPQALRRIVFPQAFAASLPNLTNSLIGMLHGSTLAFTVSVVEIMAKAQIVASTNWKFFEAYLAAALIFWGLTVLIERIAARVERRINVYNRGGVA